MKKQELKKLLKPLIKECIKEVILEEGILSNVVSEVVQGLGAPRIVEAKAAPVQQQSSIEDMQRAAEQKRAELNEQKNKLLSTINKDAYGGVDIFEGTTPMSNAGKPASGPTAQGPLAGVEPGDPGVDISGILGLAGGRWSAHMKPQD